jgi:hypothetical protein
MRRGSFELLTSGSPCGQLIDNVNWDFELNLVVPVAARNFEYQLPFNWHHIAQPGLGVQ